MDKIYKRIPLVTVVLALPFAAADLARNIQHPTTQTTIPTRTLEPNLSESSLHRYNAHASRVTAPPAVNLQQLFGRQAVQTSDLRFCAFQDGDGASPIYCPNNYSCVLLEYSTAWGCCNARGCVNAPRTCFEDDDPENYCRPGAITIDCSALFTSYLTCAGNKPKCATYIYKSDTRDPQNINGPASWSCAAAATQILVYPFAITNAEAQVTYKTDLSDSTASPTSTSSPKSQDGNDNNNNNNNKKGQLDVGAIIGIIVAAIGVLATVMVGLFPRQMTRCLTCGLRPKKDQSNEEIRKNAWLFISGKAAAPASQLHIHYHHTPTDQQPLAQGGAPIGLSPITSPGGHHQGYWPQQPAQQPQQGQWGYSGYDQHPPPAYQTQHGYGYGGEYISPAQYAAPQRYEVHEQQKPFLEMEDTGKR